MDKLTADPPADQYYLYVLALSKQVTLTQLVTALAERLGPLQMVELVTVPAVTETPAPAPWWQGVLAGQRVRVVRDTIIMGADGRPATAGGRPITRAAGALLDVTRTPTEADRTRGWVQVFGERAPFPGGLYALGADLGPAE